MNKEIIVVGGGLAGLSATMKAAENGCKVKLISLTHVKRSHSVCAQGGINAAVNLKGEDDSPYIHAYDTLKGGDFLAHQPPVLEMCLAAPEIIYMFDRFGCTFNRTPEGNINFRRFGGTLYNRTAFCGASTGQQLLYSLDEQVRRYEVKGLVEKFEHHEFLRLILDEQGNARGIVFQDLYDLKIDALKADAVVIATGGPGMIYKKTTNSTFCTGAANGRLYMQGMQYANGEFIQIHPTAVPGIDKMRLMSESLRGEGGRVWVYGDATKSIKGPQGNLVQCGETGKPWFFFEELYPAIGNLIPRDIASREILKVIDAGLGIEGRAEVYLDVTHLRKEVLHKLESVLNIYQKFTGEDPRKVPMRIHPAMHYSMGGAWVDYPAADDSDRMQRYRHMTNIKGCFNCGESDYLYHGANRLGANSLLSCVFSGLVVGKEIARYLDTENLPSLSFAPVQQALDAENHFKEDLLSRRGTENIHQLHEELSHLMVTHVSVNRSNPELEKTLEAIKKIRERYQRISLSDRGATLNQTYVFANQFRGMLELALVITKGALLRDEFRGAHSKEGFTERDDKHFLKSTIATYHPEEPRITYEPVDIRHLKPILRDYVHAHKVKPQLENVPKNIPLPL